ncbi:MAG: hypothetical protein K2W88_02440 [Pararheinheimera sp.]|nr:hypothetical protein [Rheinheimera sp.]
MFSSLVCSAQFIESFDHKNKTEFARTLEQNKDIEWASGQGVDNTDAVLVLYRGNERGSNRVLLNKALDSTALTSELSFSVKFCDGFDFVKGGKLHGLGPLKPVSGGKKVKPEEWSARLMFGKGGMLKTYVYHQRMEKKFGSGKTAKNFKFKPGQYYRISMYVQLNNPVTSANGSLLVTVDGKALIEHKGIQFRAVDDKRTEIQTLMFNTFHGGQNPDWAPKKPDGSFDTECAYFDDFSVILD